MKKIFALLLCVVAIFSLISCSVVYNGDLSGQTQQTQQSNGKTEININNGGSASNSESVQTITVELNGGYSDFIIEDDTTFDDLVKHKPIKDGFVFAGWYSDANLNDYIDPDLVLSEQRNKGKLYAKWITVESVTYQVRSNEVTITDSGRAKQQLDIVYLSQDYDLAELRRAGYTALNVTISLYLREVDDGYQYVFLYSDKNCAHTESALEKLVEGLIVGEGTDEDPSLLCTKKYEHTPGECDTNWAVLSFEVPISLDRLTDNLYIRYGASGKNDDHWRNKDVVVTVTPVK